MERKLPTHLWFSQTQVYSAKYLRFPSRKVTLCEMYRSGLVRIILNLQVATELTVSVAPLFPPVALSSTTSDDTESKDEQLTETRLEVFIFKSAIADLQLLQSTGHRRGVRSRCV